MQGIVLRVDAKVCHVQVGTDTHVLPLRGRLFETPGEHARPVAVGDRVEITLGEQGGAIDAVLPRSSKLSRRRAGEDSREQVLAANITLVMAVASMRKPTFQPELLDRILAGAEREGISPIVVFTKTDLDRKDEREKWQGVYTGIGYPVYMTSVTEGRETHEVFDDLRALLRENVSVLTGASGVGKSSLINHLIPGLDLRVGSLGKIQQGRHTTTHSQLIPLPGGGHVLDTPGIRNFGLQNLDVLDLSFCMPEFLEPMKKCEYRDCTHIVEPGCGILAALERSEIDSSRYASYTVMLEDLHTD